MSTISIKEDVKEELLRYASELQMRLGRKVDYNEAIRHLLNRRRKHPALLREASASMPGAMEARDVLVGEKRRDDERLRSAFAADADALIELVYETPMGEALRDAMLGKDVEVVTHEVAVAELRYVLCRLMGREASKSRVGKLLASGYLLVEDVGELVEAEDYKYERTISLTDCFTLSLGRSRSPKILFASREGELTEEMERSPFDVEIHFLEDYEPARRE